MRNLSWVAVLSALTFPLAMPSEKGGDPAELLRNVASRYKKLSVYQIEAEMAISVASLGNSGSTTQKASLAVGKNGAYRVEQQSETALEVSVSDGKTTWKALPNRKIWSKQELSQVSSEDDDEEAVTPPSMSQDLFTQTQHSLVSRYIGLPRYADLARIEKSDKQKFNGEKVECYVVRIDTPESANRLYIAKDSFLILKHVEQFSQRNNRQVQITTIFKSISEEPPPASMFDFPASSYGNEVATLLLPSERNVSLVGQRAMDFTLKNISGETVHLSELHGKVVLLDFWATWCPACREELPTIAALSRKYKARNVVFFGVDDEDTKTVRSFLDKHHPDLASLYDEKGKVRRQYGCTAIPTVMVIDPAGKIAAHFIGGRSEGELVAALKQAGMQ